MKEAHRQHGTIESVRTGDDDGRMVTTYLFINLTNGGRQGFGGYVLNENAEKWNGEICALFGVATLDDLVGKHCWALRAFSGWSENIEGIEASDGKRFVATDFWRRTLTEPVPDPLEKARESCQREIAHFTRRINEETRRLAGLEMDYVEWSVAGEKTRHE